MGQGSDIAMDVAKITIMTPDLGKIADAIRLSAATVRTIRQNLFWAFIYNLIGVPVAAGVLFPLNGFLLNPMLAGAAMALSSVSVVANSLRLKAKGGRARKNDGREPIPINNMEKTMEKIVALAKSRGFVYPGSEIYGGLANTWDYGNLGVELKNNVMRAWWQ